MDDQRMHWEKRCPLILLFSSTFFWQDIGDPSYLGISFIEDLNNTQFANIHYFNTVFSIPPLLFIELLSPKMSSFGNRAIILLE
jgi:hypothetical protein